MENRIGGPVAGLTSPRPRGALTLWQVAALVAGIVLLTTAIGLGVGYRYFWYKSTLPTRVQRNLIQAEAVVKAYPKEADAWVDLGYAQLEAGRLKQARKSLRRAIEMEPRIIWFHYFLGLIEFEDRKYQQAAAEFRQVTAAYPDNPLAFYMLARVAYEQGQYDQALRQATHIITQIDRSIADAYEVRGQAYEKKGQREQAIDDYLTATRMDPSREVSRAGLRRLGVPERSIPGPPDGAPKRLEHSINMFDLPGGVNHP